ncbi:MAG: cation-translocating P-type ATPase [Gammaproteobacteria bacterium]
MDAQPGFADALQAELSRLRGVRWAAVNAVWSLAVVQYDRRRLPRPRGSDAQSRLESLEDRVIAVVEHVEHAHGLQAQPFRAAQHPDSDPGDPMPVARTLLELGLDGAAIAASLVLRRVGVRPRTLPLDAAALLALVGSVPRLRAVVERRIGVVATEAALEAGTAVVQMLLRGEVGAAGSTLHRALRLRELRARRALWPQWEASACANAACARTDGVSLPRPQPLPEGPIERYTMKAAAGSLGVFAGTLLATGRQESVAAVVAGVPKPARLGREAFAAQLGTRLAASGTLVADPQALRRLDRVDCLVFGAGLASLDGELAPLARAARRAGLQCAAVAPVPPHCEPLRAVDGDAAAAVRVLQGEGRGVLFIDAGAGSGYAVADCSVALAADRGAPPWQAHLWCPGGLEQARALIDAAALARAASEQAVELAVAEVALGVALSSAGVDARSARRVLLAASCASIVAMANGVRLAQRLVLAPPQRAGRAAPPWHAMTADAVLAELDSGRGGLSSAQAARRRQPPLRPPRKGALLLRALGTELRTPMAPVLGAGAALSALSGGALDAALILSTLGINAAYGSAARVRTERLLQSLASHEAAQLRVWRDGRVQHVDEASLVVGDVVALQSGDTVPADCRIVEAQGLELDESGLTGESLPVAKDVAPCAAGQIAERRSMLYAGTAVAAGTAKAVVVALGDDSESGRAAAGGARPPTRTGVEARLERLTQLSAPLAGGGALLLAGLGRARGRPLREVLGTAVSLSVAAVPEGLPLLAGLAQATVAGRLSGRGALVRDPRAVEALGRMSVLCADKTGTLTEGSIRLRVVSDGVDARASDALGARHREVLAIALRASPPGDSDEAQSHLTDRALLDGADAAEVGSHDGLRDWRRLDELPFEPGRAFHAGLAQHRDGRLISVKGAPEAVLPRCSHIVRNGRRTALTPARRRALERHADALAQRGFRVLAVAERGAHARGKVDDGRVQGLQFHGFVGFADAVRPAARTAVAALRGAGIRVVMLTGDHPMTAQAIAEDVGLDAGAVLTGAELEALDDDALAERVAEVGVFARVTPAHKVRIVRAFQRAGQVVGMTGDGANDAPAIRLAEVGIALGEHATAAARAAADVVVADGRIETIVAAVLEGRALWLSMRDAVSLLVGGNLGELLFTIAGSLIGSAVPLNARQLLLVNLFSDAVPALAVALRPRTEASPETLLRAGPDASLGEDLQRALAWRAAATATGASSAWLAARPFGSRPKAGTVGLLALTGTQLAQTVIVGRGDRRVLLSCVGTLALLLTVIETPGVSRVFGCRPLGPLGLAQAAAGSAIGASAQLLLPRLDAWLRDARPRSAQ